jgi:succinate-acetate transporter protein
MKALILVLRLLLAVALITWGCNSLSKPSNISVAGGLFAIAIALVVLYRPAKSLINQL